MYHHPLHRLDDPAALAALIADHPLGAWVVQGEGEGEGAAGLIANDLPFVLRREPGQPDGLIGHLIGHVARANPVWRALPERGMAGTATAGAPCVVMFRGPQAYISPRWYPGKAEHGRVVPTWNYAAAHVHGQAQAVHDPLWLRAMLDALTQAQEADPQLAGRPWQVTDAPPDYLAALQAAIVGIEITITRIEGRLKASQDEAWADRQGTVTGLRQMPARAGEAAAVAALVAGAMEAGGA
ncbi:MAG: hypothetical protein RL722_14 [Pseudomonadota bacterium]|jgi:transcriptional regulator